ncbi:hypothetical protein HPB50_012503 [Hyalomma asiaticum]|uniref:Uncharacterized protein n=1 Tax=Hyalomma asiaticum TaxID=266040 RepID=A0ACB7SDA4_HYAAI|nr:hypothetical protein HPB50_012503 [Hyalomma asiaticum]
MCTFLTCVAAEVTGCTLVNKDSKSEKTLLEGLHDLKGETFTVEDRVDGKLKNVYEIGVCASVNKSAPQVGAVQHVIGEKANQTFVLGQLNSTTLTGAKMEIAITDPVTTPHERSSSLYCAVQTSITFFTAAGGYLLLGFLYKRIVVGAKGLEQIPNYSFWKDCGNLQADGCNYICRCQCDSSDEHRSYRDIDDRPLRPDEDRDDQLLTM